MDEVYGELELHNDDGSAKYPEQFEDEFLAAIERATIEDIAFWVSRDGQKIAMLTPMSWVVTLG